MKKTVCIYGCAKNVEKYLPDVFRNIDKLREIFDVKGMYIGYDNSNDSTRDLLVKYGSKTGDLHMCYPSDGASKDKLTDSYGNQVPVTFAREDFSNVRCINICNARNRCLRSIQDSGIGPELIIAMDLDDVCSGELDISVIQQYLRRDDEWDGLTFYNEMYYDFWALSIRPFTLSCWHSTNSKALIKATARYLKGCVEDNKECGLVRCQSAFNGFGIYKYALYGDISYSVIHQSTFHNYNDVVQVQHANGILYNIHDVRNGGHIDCEHRCFHYQAALKNKARLLMATKSLFPPYQGEHCGFLSQYNHSSREGEDGNSMQRMEEYKVSSKSTRGRRGWDMGIWDFPWRFFHRRCSGEIRRKDTL